VFIIIGLLMPAYAPFLLDVRSIAADSITLDVARRYAGYAEKEVNYGYLLMYIFTIFPLLILHHVRNKIKKCKLLKCERIYINNTYNLFWYFCMLMPLAPFVTAISRMPRNAFIIFMSAISIYLYRKRMSLINNAICICLLVIMLIGFNWIEMGRSDVVINYHYIMYDNYLNDFISGFFSGV